MKGWRRRKKTVKGNLMPPDRQMFVSSESTIGIITFDIVPPIRLEKGWYMAKLDMGSGKVEFIPIERPGDNG